MNLELIYSSPEMNLMIKFEKENKSINDILKQRNKLGHLGHDI